MLLTLAPGDAGAVQAAPLPSAPSSGSGGGDSGGGSSGSVGGPSRSGAGASSASNLKSDISFFCDVFRAQDRMCWYYRVGGKP